MDSYEVILEKSTEGGYVVLVPKLPGCVTQGQTKREALKNAREAIGLMLDVLKEDGISVKDYSGIKKVELASVAV